MEERRAEDRRAPRAPSGITWTTAGIIAGILGGLVTTGLVVGNLIFGIGNSTAATKGQIDMINQMIVSTSDAQKVAIDAAKEGVRLVNERINQMQADLKERREAVAEERAKVRQDIYSHLDILQHEVDAENEKIGRVGIAQAHSDAALCYVSKGLDKAHAGVDCTHYGGTP
jgi:hypothetical protein